LKYCNKITSNENHPVYWYTRKPVLVKSGYDIVKKGDIADRVQEGILFAGDAQERSEVSTGISSSPGRNVENIT